MYWLDTLLLAIIGLGAVLGFVSGFLWQIARLVSLAAALVATVHLNGPTSAFLEEHLLQGAEPRVVQSVAYVAVFLVVYLTCYGLARLAHAWIRGTELALVDRFAGAAFGAGKAALLVGIACLGAANYPHPTTKEWLAKSTLAPAFADGMEHIVVMIPEDYKESLQATLQSLRQLLTRPAPHATPAEPKTGDPPAHDLSK